MLIISVGSPACQIDLKNDGTARIQCDGASHCPDGYRCEETIEFCVPTQVPDGDPPGVVDASVTPAAGGGGAVVRGNFSVTRQLLADPNALLRAGASTFPMTLVASTPTSFTFEYVLTGSEPEGSASVTTNLVGIEGIPANDLVVGSVEIDFTPVPEPTLGVSGGIAHGGFVWVDASNVDLTVALNSSEVPATLDVDGDIVSPVSVAFQSPLSLQLTAADGPKLIDVGLRDAAGNETRTSLVVQVDTALPTNAVLLDDPQTPDTNYWVNTDSLSLSFHSDGALPQDFDSYVVSDNLGATWSPVPDNGFYVIGAVPQDATTEYWIREQDIFGNQTAPADQAVLIVHEDSQPPTAPIALTATIVGNLSSEIGLYLAPSSDSGGTVTYQMLGGPYETFTDVGTSSRIRLPAVPVADFAPYLIRTIDRAGNTSLVVSVLVADTPIAASFHNCHEGTASCTRFEFKARRDRGIYKERNGNDVHAIAVCSTTDPSASVQDPDTLLCEYIGDITDPAAVPVSRFLDFDILERNVIYWDSAGGIHNIDIGPDRLANTGDDGGTYTVAPTGRCFAAGGNGVIYEKQGDNSTIYYYDFGADGVPGNPGVGGEGEFTVTAVANTSVCDSRFNGRHIVWFKVGNEYWLYDLGPDQQVGGGDDVADVKLADNGVLVLSDKGVFTNPFQPRGTWMDFGDDGYFATSDDTSVILDGVRDVFKDKFVIATPSGRRDLYDLSADVEIRGGNEDFGATPSANALHALSLGDGFFFGGVPENGFANVEPAVYRFFGDPFTYYAGNEEALGIPAGFFAGDYIYVDTASQPLPYFVNDVLGGAFALENTQPDLVDVDASGGKLVYVNQQYNIVFYGVGPDLIPNTGDDVGPTALTSSGPVRRWARIDGSTVVWNDFTGDADGLYYGSDLVSVIKGIDLGVDGIPGGGDDVMLDITTGGLEVMPDIAGNTVVFLDFSDDPNQRCDEVRSSPDPANCTPSIGTVDIGGPPSTLLATTAARAGLQFDGSHLVWSEYRTGPMLWDVHVMPVAGGDTVLAQGTTDYVYPTLDGSRVGYIAGEPVVVDAGGDGVFATGDDVLLRSSSGWNGCNESNLPCAKLMAGFRPAWLNSELMVLGAGMMPIDDGTDTFSRTAIALAIPDTGVPLEDAQTLGVAPWAHVEQMHVDVEILHPDVSELRIALISPSLDEVVLYDGEGSGADLNATFNLFNTPDLLNHYGEPLDGRWALHVTDLVPGNAGTLQGWSIRHRL